MALQTEHQEKIVKLAIESLNVFSKIAYSAQTRLIELTQGTNLNAMAMINTWNHADIVDELEHIGNSNIKNCALLCRTPTVARVVVVDDDDRLSTYFICGAVLDSFNDDRIMLASYSSPIGRLASLPIGEEFTVVRDGLSISVEVVENAKFHPVQENDEWDSKDSILNGDEYGSITVTSLRELLPSKAEETTSDVLDILIDQERESRNIQVGLRRSIISRMNLRVQPVLDQYQDEIFRLPINHRLLILGAPGTGKTTTLIKRLRQKIDVEFLDIEELKSARDIQSEIDIDHSQSWIMFTPTVLLQLYVKEAFNREGVSAPDERIRTWAEFQSTLSRNVFNILRTGGKRSGYIMKESVESLKPDAEIDPISWFNEFNQWQKEQFSEELRSSAEELSKNKDTIISELGSNLHSVLRNNELAVEPSTFASLSKYSEEIQNIVGVQKESTDGKIRSALNLLVNKDEKFLDDFASYIESLSELSEDADDPDADIDEEESNPLHISRTVAVAEFMRVIRSQARAKARKRTVSKKSRAGLLIAWLDQQTLTDRELLEIGESLLVQAALRRFIYSVRLYIDGIPRRYRKFRQTHQLESRWYQPNGYSTSDIHPLEVDIVLLAMMLSTDELNQNAKNLTKNDSSARETLERLQRLYRAQVLVDEATDFSPIQLRCMIILAHHKANSFFASGDFNQRVTTWGVRSGEQLKWVSPDIETITISLAYRQSKQLHGLAKQIIEESDDSKIEVALPDFVNNEGVPPVLATELNQLTLIATWLADRIQEIEGFVGELPSIAVLVNSEEEVRSVATALGDALENQNIPVTPCSDGLARGPDSAVRVFNVRHIKGLEFEAVFFVGLDKLAITHPDLFEKYLYVGATRAATYFGVICEQNFPKKITKLRKLFADHW